MLIQAGGGNNVSQVVFAECELSAPEGGTAYTGAGITLDVGADAGDVLDQVRFISCYSCSWRGAGISINGGTNIEILGGYYSCNNQSQSASFSNSGIALVGPVSGVRITGAACNNSVTNALNGHPQNPYQKYGIYVSNGASSVRINACDLTGNLTNSLVVDGTVAGPSQVFVAHCDCTGVANAVEAIHPEKFGLLEIFHCPGYNDQRPTLNGNNAPSTPISAATCSTPYFGPSVVTFWNASEITVRVSGLPNGCPMKFGDLYLSRPTDLIGFDSPPTIFGWLGK